jgi:Bacterial regulatory helix-turn-helix protein, lysR family
MSQIHIDVYIQHTMRRKIPSLQALACFDAAARHQSYTRAAQELALTQSAVSRQVGALEDTWAKPCFAAPATA